MSQAMAFLAAITVLSFFSLKAYADESIPHLGSDLDGGKVFETGEEKFVFWGVDADTWGCDAGNVEHFRNHCEASVFINANVIAIPVTWKNIEPEAPGKYDFTFLDAALAIVREHELKAVIMWIGIDYAAGDPNFVPPYIDADPDTYTRITGFHYDEQRRYKKGWEKDGVEEDRLHCPSCPATLTREAAAYENLMIHVADSDFDRTVMAINICGEINYVRAMNPADWSPERDVRCLCKHCNAAYRPGFESNVAFMTRQFANYVKTIIAAGAKHYDIPTYSQVCPHSWFPGWRYAEDPVALKAIINRPNHFVVPSVAFTEDEKGFIEENMDHFRSECIPGNVVFVDGIDTGWPTNLERLELAPWYVLMHYGGLGGIYWDCPGVSIIKEGEERRERLRKMWGPLKAMHYHVARLKSAGPEKRFWWPYHQTESSGFLGDLKIEQRSSDKDYGVAFRLGEDRFAFTATTSGGTCEIVLNQPSGFAGYRCERGCFDPVSGEWRKASEVEIRRNDEEVSLVIDGDSGDFQRAAFFLFKRED